MTAENFKVMAHCSDGWWALEVTGDDLPHPAYTQARRLDQAEAVVRDLGMAQRDISALLGISHQAVSQLLASSRPWQPVGHGRDRRRGVNGHGAGTPLKPPESVPPAWSASPAVS